ncbi:MAG: TraB/GumN family protein [Bacteroidia bacterium]|nr:TraB/GumN family protein [Bacteroidia bacterium]MDW8332912.1 TraB/GumN family protein [Bacteroidia bacterium]
MKNKRNVLAALGALCLCPPLLGQSLLWKIEGPGIAQPSYLYGTMHSRSKKVFEFSEVVWQKFSEVRAFAAELKLDSAGVKTAAAMLRAPADSTLDKLLSPKDYALVAKTLKKETGIELSAYNGFKPLYVQTILQQTDLTRGEMPKFLDQFLFDKAVQEGKIVLGVETPEEQGRAFGALGMKKQAEMLVEACKKLDAKRKENAENQQKLLRIYLSGNLEEMTALIEADEMPAEMKKILIDDRNRTMADRIAEFVRIGPTFIGVGAAHLPGKNGVVELLRAKGFTLTPIPFAFDGTGYERVRAELEKPDEQGWVVHRGEKYRALFPATPVERLDTAKTDKGQEQIVKTAMFVNMTTQRVFSVSVSPADPKSVASPAKLKKTFAKKLKEQAAKNNGKVSEQKKITADGRTGYEAKIEVAGLMELTLRLFAAGDKLYTLAFGQLKGDYGQKDKQKFFEGFKIEN